MNPTRRLLASILVITLSGSPAVAVEEPAFRTVLKDGAFEIRDYPALTVAEVTVSGGQNEAASRGFRLLAGYIFGGNTRGQSIAMTAPVTQIADAGRWIVRFTMPRAYTLDTLPRPSDPAVRLTRLPAARVAAIRFSGLAGKADVAAKSADLVAAVKARRLHAVGALALAQYDPPWTPWFLRRNEVMVAVAP
jgi:DNA gyrase inhibitor GyrI